MRYISGLNINSLGDLEKTVKINNFPVAIDCYIRKLNVTDVRIPGGGGGAGSRTTFKIAKFFGPGRTRANSICISNKSVNK